MARSEAVGRESCSLSRRWVLEPILGHMLVRLDQWAAGQFSSQGLRWPGLFIISGHRSPLLQAEINPLAPASLHTRCPSLAADLRVGDLPASLTGIEIWHFLGQGWGLLGGRWGGSFSPPDNNHFDLPSLSLTG